MVFPESLHAQTGLTPVADGHDQAARGASATRRSTGPLYRLVPDTTTREVAGGLRAARRRRGRHGSNASATG